MKKLTLILIALVLSIATYGQSTFRRGIKVGTNGVVIDSIKVVDDTIRYYANGTVQTGESAAFVVDTTSLSDRIDAIVIGDGTVPPYFDGSLDGGQLLKFYGNNGFYVIDKALHGLVADFDGTEDVDWVNVESKGIIP